MHRPFFQYENGDHKLKVKEKIRTKLVVEETSIKGGIEMRTRMIAQLCRD